MQVLHYLAVEDLARAWRVAQPNLEQTGLLKIEYAGLDELVANEALWSHPIIGSVAPPARKTILTAILDHMRSVLILDDRALTDDETRRLVQRANAVLREPWSFDEHERLRRGGIATLQANEPGTIDGLSLLTGSDKCSDRKAREVIARKKSLIGKVPIDVEVGLRAIAFIQEKLNFPLGFPFTLLGRVPVFPCRTGIVDDFARRIALLCRRLVELAPAPECLIEPLRSRSSNVFDPGLRIPMCLGELGPTG
jgi:hypothetical protein